MIKSACPIWERKFPGSCVNTLLLQLNFLQTNHAVVTAHDNNAHVQNLLC